MGSPSDAYLRLAKRSSVAPRRTLLGLSVARLYNSGKQGWHYLPICLLWQTEARRAGGVGRQAAAVVGGREPTAEEAVGRGDAGQRHAEGYRFKKMVTPAAKPEAAAHLCSVHGVSQRRACRVIGAERMSIRYRHRRPDDGAMRSRLRELAAGLLASRRDGKRVFYRPSDPSVLDLTASLRRVAERNSAEVRDVIAGYFQRARCAGAGFAQGACPALKDDLVTVLDVRPEDEYAAGHLPKAVNIPLRELARRCGTFRGTGRSSPIAVAPTACWLSRRWPCCAVAALRSAASRMDIPNGRLLAWQSTRLERLKVSLTECCSVSNLGWLPEQVRRLSKVRTLEAGEVLFRQGDRANAIFEVDHGRMRLIRHTIDNRPIALHTARAGELFAEAALFADRYHCDAVAASAARVHIHPKRPLLAAFRNDPALSERFMATLAKQIHALRSRLEGRNIRSARERVLNYLVSRGRAPTAVR